MDHNAHITKMLSLYNSESGILQCRESLTVEFKESFNKANIAKYAKTMAAFSNNRGGYIVFGVKDKPRKVIGLKNDNFDNLNQEQFTEAINSLFSPAIEWECGIATISVTIVKDNEEPMTDSFKIGWIYTEESENKPIMATKANESEKITNGDIYYRYRAQTHKIRAAEMMKIIDARLRKEREGLLKLFEVVQKNGTANLGIVNYSNGMFTTPYGVDVAFDRKLVMQVLRKAKYIKEGSFNETEGIPVIKVTGNIDLAEEVPVPDGDPDLTHPFIQKQLAELLGIRAQDVYALIWYFKMKEARKYHIEITSSKSGKIHKFSQFALQFLREKLKELCANPDEFNRIKAAYNNRNKEEYKHGSNENANA